MIKERSVITQAMCDHVKILIKGGATVKQAAQITGTSPATITRIRQAEYDVVKYNQNNDRRRIEEKDRKADERIRQLVEDLKHPGQMKMELVYDPAVAEEYKKEQEQKQEENRMMRFQAGQVSLLLSKLDRLNDTMSMILRAIRKE